MLWSYLNILFISPSIILHEFSQYVVAKALNFEIQSYEVIPEINDEDIKHGFLDASTNIQALYIPFSIAPLLWIFILFLTFRYIGILDIALYKESVFYVYFNYSWFFHFSHLIYDYAFLQLLLAGTLTRRDMTSLFRGLLSPVMSIFFFSLLVIILLNNFLLHIF